MYTFCMELLNAPDVHVIDHQENDSLQLVLGVDHVRCTDQLGAYQFYYKQFLGHISSHNTEPLILYEGVSIPNDESSEEACLRSERGEVSLLFRWGRRDGIRLKSFEVSDSDLLKNLALKTGYPQEIGMYLMARQHRQWYDMSDRPDFTEYMANVLNRYRKVALELEGLPEHVSIPEETFDVERAIAHFNYAYKPVGKEFNIQDRDFLQDETANKRRYGDNVASPLRLITRDVDAIRQRHAKNMLLREADLGNSTFAFIGHPHIRPLGNALRRKVHSIPVRDCIGRLATGTTHRPMTHNPVRAQVAYGEHSISLDKPTLPVIEARKGDVMQLVVGVNKEKASEQYEVIRYMYEEFLGHIATHDTSGVMLRPAGRYSDYAHFVYEWAEDDSIACQDDGWGTPQSAALFHKLWNTSLPSYSGFNYMPTPRNYKRFFGEYMSEAYSAIRHYDIDGSLANANYRVSCLLQLLEHYYGAPLPHQYRISSDTEHAASRLPARLPPDFAYMAKQTHIANVLRQRANEYKSVFMVVDRADLKTLLPRIRQKLTAA